MDIIALLLHISWDRKCSYQILVSEAEAETVVCSCFRIAPDLELPAVKPERGSTDFVRGWGGVGWGAHVPCGCTDTQDDPLWTHV